MNKVTVHIENHVAQVGLYRPDKLNALDIELVDQLIDTAARLDRDETVRAVVLFGHGKAFCAGLDLSNFSLDPDSALNQSLIARTHGILNRWQKVAWVWREIAVPVIAAGHGAILGGGLQIFSGADIRYVHPDAQLSIMEVKWGIVPDMSGTQLWRHTVRDDVLRELVYTHRIFDGKQAEIYGFATHCVDQPLEAAISLAYEIASKSPSAIVQSKLLLNQARYMSEADGLMAESEVQEKIIRKHNQIEAVFSQMQQRKPIWHDYRDEEKDD